MIFSIHCVHSNNIIFPHNQALSNNHPISLLLLLILSRFDPIPFIIEPLRKQSMQLLQG